MAETTSIGQSSVSESNIVELIYQNKFDNIKHCIIPEELANKYNAIIDSNRDDITRLSSIVDTTVDQDGYDQDMASDFLLECIQTTGAKK